MSGDRNMGSVHKSVTVDIDAYPVLEIDVASINYYWFLILSGEQFHSDPSVAGSKDGYFSVQEPTNRTGRIAFDIKEITGLSGRQSFDLQIGVGRPAYGDNKGAMLVLRGLRLKRAK